MSPELTALCLVLAFVCFVLAAAAVKAAKYNLMAAGLALWVAPSTWAAIERL